jgi:hypothetical protein
MVRRIAALTALTVAALWPGAVRAQDQAALLNQFVMSPQAQSAIASAIPNLEPEPLKAQCSALRVLDASRYLPAQAVFAKQGANWALQSGGVVVVAVVDRCGKRVQRRIVLIRKHPNEPVKLERLTPGDFGGNIKLELDTLRIVMPFATIKAGCPTGTPAYPIDTRNISPISHDGGEVVWTFWACGKPVEADVHYTPLLKDGALVGMNISAGQFQVLDKLP